MSRNRWLSRMAVLLVGLLLTVSCQISDTIVPSIVRILAPVRGGSLPAGDIPVIVFAADETEIAKVEIKIDDTLRRSADASQSGLLQDTFKYTWPAAGAVQGRHYVEAKAFDKAGNYATDTLTFNIGTGGGPGDTSYHHSENVVVDEVWYPRNNPHIVEGKIDVWQEAKLTIMPGCIVKFNAGVDAGLVLGNTTPGELIAIGKPDSHIVFTSNAATPNPGDWFGIQFQDQARATCAMSYCDISYAGYQDAEAVLCDWGGSAFIDHCRVQHSAGMGFSYEHTGYVKSFHDNVVTNCGSYPVEVDADFLGELGTGNVLTGNAAGYDCVFVWGNTISKNATWHTQGVPFQVHTSIGISHSASPVVTILPGTTLRFAPDQFLSIGESGLNGGLIADSVTFTSSAATPAPGGWDCLTFGGNADASSRLRFCTVQYGASGGFGLVAITDCRPEIRGCHFGRSSNYGIGLYGNEHPAADSLELHMGNTFDDCPSGNVFDAP